VPPDPDALAALVCPDDRQRLERAADALLCPRCGARFPLRRGIPDFVWGAGARTARWRAAQRYELAWWRRHGAGGREAERARLAEGAAGVAAVFDETTGRGWRDCVVHVGPAAHGEIHHLPARRRFAVEPLAPALAELGLLEPGDVTWVAAMGERLPFADRSVTGALLPNVIDHVADPPGLLAELHRCLAPGAPLWISAHVTRPSLVPVMTALGVLRLGYFAGHPWSFSAGQLRDRVERAGFRIVREQPGDAASANGAAGWRGRLKSRLLSTCYWVAVA
jgi:hypothetical protein